ncbi:hypothetical protein [Vibrio gallicus]|uniref:hypothetical protein n=1 Tax=Vibrio gallicus TaxID=190897 RepID=UPI0021C3615C|nr:hypothetical protein [Vibrio gallicus]
MRQGIFVTLLSILLCGPVVVKAAEINPQQRELLLQNTRVQSAAQNISSLALTGQSDQAQFQLQRIKYPQQEAARYLAIKTIADKDPNYTSDLAVFLDRQKRVAPTLQFVQNGDGFRFSTPAFGYQILAQRLLDEWQLNEKVMSFYIGVETEQLELRSWLSGDANVAAQHERLLIESVNSLSSDGLQFIIDQITASKVVSWLPSSKVMVALASVSKDPQLYSLLWKMKSDGSIDKELDRLGHQDSSFAHQQLMVASDNPSLNKQSLHLLSRYVKTSAQVQDFLVGKMRNQQQAQIISNSLLSYGYENWLKQLLQDNPSIALP